MDLKYYNNETEIELRIKLEELAKKATKLKSISKIESNEETAQEYTTKAKEIKQQMVTLVCETYLNNPRNTFYTDFLRETGKIRKDATNRHAVISEELAEEASKNTLIRNCIRKGRRMSEEQQQNSTPAEFDA